MVRVPSVCLHFVFKSFTVCKEPVGKVSLLNIDVLTFLLLGHVDAPGSAGGELYSTDMGSIVITVVCAVS